MVYEKKKTVHFYAVQPQKGATYRRATEAVDWCEFMEKRRALSDELNTINGVFFDHRVEGDTALLIMHKPLSPEFMTKLNTQGGNRDTSKEDRRALKEFAQATAVAFCADGRIIAVGKGSPSSPGTKTLTEYLDYVLPQSGGWHWSISAFQVNGTPEELKRATGARRLEMRYHTVKDLFGQDAANEDPLAVGPESIARELGTDISVHVEFGLPVSSSPGQQRTMLRMIQNGMRTILHHSHSSPPKVIAEVDNEEREYILTKHKLTRQVEIPISKAQKHSFSALSEEVIRVAHETEDQIRADL